MAAHPASPTLKASALAETTNHYIERTAKSNWVSVYRLMGLERCLDQMSGYYGNVSLAATLMAAFIVTILAAPPDPLLESDNELIARVSAVFGMATFLIFTVTVMNCIQIDNSLRMLSTGDAFLDFMVKNRGWMARPVQGLFLGFLLTCVYVTCLLYVLYGMVVTAISGGLIALAFAYVIATYKSGVQGLARYAEMSSIRLAALDEKMQKARRSRGASMSKDTPSIGREPSAVSAAI